MHYLQKELNDLMRDDSRIFDFLRVGTLDGLWYWDLDNPEHEWMDDRFWQTLGYDAKEKKPLSSEWQDLIFKEDLELAIANFNKHCVDPNHPYDQVVRYKHKDGSTVWIRCRGVVIRDDNQKPIRMLGAHNDITDLKNTQMQLQKSNEELYHFANMVSHDLKAPLRTGGAFLELIKKHFEGQLTEKVSSYFDYIENANRRMTALIQDLHELATLQVKDPEKSDISVTELISAVINDLHADIENADAVVNVEECPNIVGYPSVFRRLVQNLISNAIKFRLLDTPPEIQIGYSDLGTFWQFYVKDNGIGIDPKYQNQIFEAFTRLQSQDEYEGSGIGLNVCRKAVELHGGTIWVKSEKNKGSSFYFTIKK